MANLAYELPHELLNDFSLSLRKLGNIEEISKFGGDTALCPVSLPQGDLILGCGSQIAHKNRYYYVKSVQIRKYFWPVISSIRSEYGDLLRKSPYSAPIQENTDQK